MTACASPSQSASPSPSPTTVREGKGLPPQERRRLAANLTNGLPPPPHLADECLAGLDGLVTSWKEDLTEFLPAGGSLLRIVVGAPGTGKTHLGRALKAVGSKLGYLVCQVDMQAQGTSDDDLALYRAFCDGLMLPGNYLEEDPGENEAGLRSVLADVAERLSDGEVRRALAGVATPIPFVREALRRAAEALRPAADGPAQARTASLLLSLLGGELPAGVSSYAKFREGYGNPFSWLRRIPTRRDAGLWLESLLLALPALGYSGVILVIDEHDDQRVRTLDQSIRQLRRRLDRFAESSFPHTFVLYLVLDDFPERVKRNHQALEQRIVPILPVTPGDPDGRLLTELADVRESEGEEFLVAVGSRLFAVCHGTEPPAKVVASFAKWAEECCYVNGPNPRAFVKRMAHLLVNGSRTEES